MLDELFLSKIEEIDPMSEFSDNDLQGMKLMFAMGVNSTIQVMVDASDNEHGQTALRELNDDCVKYLKEMVT